MTYAAMFQITKVASNTIGINGVTFNFATAQADPSGHVPDWQEEVQEELSDLGINGRRWRRIHKQYQPFMLNTVADAATYAAVKSLAQQYRMAKGNFGTLAISLDGTFYQFANVKVADVKPQVRKGVLVGAGATASSAAILTCQWTLVLAP